MPRAEIAATNTVRLSDLKLAAFLAARGHRLCRVSRMEKRVFFHFLDSKAVATDIDNFRFADATTCARTLFAAFERLKDILFERGTR